MPTFTFIHAADLHLGAPFRGLDSAAPESFGPVPGRGNLLAEAGFQTLDRLEAACRETGADFLILAGDIYDDKDGVLRARFALRDMFLRLRDAGVRVFIAHGNHDPFRTGPQPMAWPDNVTVFGPEVSCACVMRDGAPLALVHGISHAKARETENLALRFKRYAPPVSGTEAEPDADATFAALPENLPAGIFQIAVLHCAVGGAGDEHAPYAPCSLTDLTDAGQGRAFDYWALGHVHQGKTLCEDPFVVYPGSVLGLHVNETGPRGCCVVRVNDDGASTGPGGPGERVTLERLPLAPVVWEKIRVIVDEETETLDVLEERIATVLDNAAENAGAALLCRVILEGSTELDAVLRRPGSAETLLERVRVEAGAAGGTGDDGGLENARVWVKDIIVATSPVRDFAALAGRDDLVGEVVRMAAAMGDDGERAREVVEKAVAPLVGNAKLKKTLSGDSGEVEEEDALLAREASSLLCSLLEGGE